MTTDHQDTQSRIVTVTYNGVDADFFLPHEGDLIQSKIAEEHAFYEQELLEDVAMRVEPGGVAIDAGANIGNHTIFLAKHAGLSVHAFEPNPTAFSILERNVELNGIQERVTLYKAGLGAEEGERTVHVVDAANLGKTMLKRGPGEEHRARIIRLDDLEFEKQVAVIKIDVEGMELEVLRGGRDLIRRDRPLIYVEAKAPGFLASVEQFLVGMGYTALDRFNSTPTYLFIPLEDDSQKVLAISKRLSELYRDVRDLNDRTSHLPQIVNKEVRQLATVMERQVASRLTGFDESVAKNENAAKRLATTTRKADEILSAIARQAPDVAAIRRQLEDLAGAAKDPTAELRAELARLEYLNALYRKKIETLLESASWRYTAPVRVLGGRLAGKNGGKPMSAAAFFEKADRKAASISGGVIQGRARRSPSRPKPNLSEVGDIRGRFARRNNVELGPNNSSIWAAMATIPERREALEQVVESLLPQVDRLCIFLNDWDSVPSFLVGKEKITVARSQEHGNRGDAGKFFWVDEHDGFYFTVDDDIIYCSDYVARSLAKLEQYEFSAAVGWHGSLLKEPFVDYYSNHSRRVFSFEYDRPEDTPAHVLGTGCLAFHTSTVRVRHADFPEANMADVFFARLAQEQQVPLVVVAHEKGDLVAIPEAQTSSINLESRKNSETAKNTRARQNELVAEVGSWRTFEWHSLRVLLVGRFEGFKKGGIYKSCALIEGLLEARGNTVHTHDTEQPFDVIPDVDIAWIYPGDPDRPDYASVNGKIEQLRARGIPVIVNFSYLATEERSRWIARQVRTFNADSSKPPVFAALFTESVQEDPLLRPLTDFLVMVPKTIETDAVGQDRGFEDREGICFGDATKLGNESIIGGPIKPWIDACRRRLPHARLYAYKQYSGKKPHEHLTYVPHMPNGFGDWLADRRLFVCLNRHLTFEMVACEAQKAGSPVLYRHMPHSLSEYIGPTGIRVRTPGELAEMCAWLYNDERAWSQFSTVSKLNAAAVDHARHASNLEGSLRMAIFRAKERTER